MFRLSGILLVLFAVFVGGLLFKTSQSVQRAEQDVAKIERALKKEKESYRILTVEWDYLNRPERLERLTQENLDIDKVGGDKAGFVRSKDTIPEPRVPVLPTVKPKSFLHYAGGKKLSIEPAKAETIKNAESENFGKVMSAQDSAAQAGGEE